MRLLNVFESISFVLTWGGAQQQRSGTRPLASSTQPGEGKMDTVTAAQDDLNCHQAIRSVWWPHSDLSHRRAIPYPTGKRHSGVYAALQPDLLRHRSAAYPPGHRYPAPGSWRCKRACTEHDQQGVPPTGNRWRGGSHGRLGIYVRDQQKPREIKTPPHIRNRGVTDLDREVRKCVDGLLNAGCTLQLTRSCSPRRSTGGCAAAPACWSAHREKTSAPRC